MDADHPTDVQSGRRFKQDRLRRPRTESVRRQLHNGPLMTSRQIVASYLSAGSGRLGDLAAVDALVGDH